MISLSQYKANLLAIMRIMIQSQDAYMDVVYKGRAYRITVEDLGVEVVQRRRPRKRSLADKVDTRKCPHCKKLMIQGVCMNSRCASNFKASSRMSTRELVGSARPE